MLRIGLGIIVGFFAWAIVWFGAESLLSAAWPAFGEHQAAFQSAIENGSEFICHPYFSNCSHLPRRSSLAHRRISCRLGCRREQTSAVDPWPSAFSHGSTQGRNVVDATRKPRTERICQTGKALLDSAGNTPEIKVRLSYPKSMKPERLPSFLETLV